ncbi:MAG: DNA primase [Patescibacteria group bacterium]
MMTQTEEIKSKLDIVDVINEYVPLKQSGANFKAPCPFHEEKTPSFMVSRERQFFKCFGCGIGGDIFTFLQKYENLEFPEALQILAEKAGVKLVRQDPVLTNLKTRLYDLHSLAVEFYKQTLFSKEGEQALKYLREQRKLPDEIIKEFNLGLAPNDWNRTSNFLKSNSFTDYEIKQSGLVVEKSGGHSNYYDRFRWRLMFPIEDHHNKFVGFTGRALNSDEPAKYINSPQTIIYNKSQVLFGLNKAKEAIKQQKQIILVEGNMDVIASHVAKIKNVVAASGTSLTMDQIQLIRRYTENVAMCFDSDIAGVKAAERSIEMLWQEDMNIKVILLPKGIKDPDELVQKNFQKWVEVVKNATNFMDYFFVQAIGNKNLDMIDDKRSIAKILLPWITRLHDPISKNHYIKLLSEKIHIEESTLHESLERYGKNKNYSTGFKQGIKRQKEAPASRLDLISHRFLALLIYAPDLIKKSIDLVEPKYLADRFQEFYKSIIIYYTKGNTISRELLREYFNNSGQDIQVQFFDTLELLAKTEFENFSEREIMAEYELSIRFLKNKYISEKKAQLQEQIRKAESNSDSNEANRLMEEFVKL